MHPPLHPFSTLRFPLTFLPMPCSHASSWNSNAFQLMLTPKCLQSPYVHSVQQVMTQLEELDMSDCPRLEALPATLGLLAKLQRLDVSDCALLKRLPPSLGNLRSLRWSTAGPHSQHR